MEGTNSQNRRRRPIRDDPALGAARVLLNTGPNAEDRLVRLFLGTLVRETLPISNRVPVRLTHERKWQ